MHVNFESLYGMYESEFAPIFCLSTNAVITCLRVNKLLLISILSFAYCPVVPVKLYFSEPARSTSYNLLTVTFIGFLMSAASIVNEKIL